MLKPIIKNSISQSLPFAYSNCTLTGKNTQQKVDDSSNDSVWNDGCDRVRLKQAPSVGEPNAFRLKKGEKKKVEFSPTLEQVASDDNAKKPASKRPPHPLKKKAAKKQCKNGNIEACLNGKDLPPSGVILTEYQRHSCWDFTQTKWAARLEDLVEMDKETLKCIRDKSSSGSEVYFNDCQAHLRIGTGPDYSSVFLGVMDGSTRVAVKKINVRRAPLLQDEARQCSLTGLPPNPCLARVHFIARDKTQFYIVRELCENSLRLEMKMWQFVPEAMRPYLDYVDLCRETAKSVACLHASNCCHMALRPENIFVTKFGGIKLADYGIHGRNINKKQQYENGVLSLCWLPAEALENGVGHLTKASDVASLGMVFFWLITSGSHPFGDPEHAANTCTKNIMHGHYNLKAIEDPYAHHLIQHMIFKEPKKRMTISQVLNHPYFWTEDQKAGYIALLARTVQLITGSSTKSDTMCSALMQVLKTKESSILRFCTDVTLLKDIPNEIKTDLTKLLVHSYSNQQRGVNGAKVFNILSAVYPGIVVEIHSKFSTEDLENLISELIYIGGVCGKQDPFFLLQPCLSADSGIESPGVDMLDDFEGYDIPTFPFEVSKRNREDSECYASTDDGIDVLSPVCGSFTDEHVFSSPVKINAMEVKSKFNAMNLDSLSCSHEGYSSSVDKHFEFDGLELSSDEATLPLCDVVWTDMDELD